MKRIRYILGVFWHFRLYLLSVVLVLILWDTIWLKPFRIFVVIVHEICHATAALLTGGTVLEMRTNPDESGHTLTQGGFFPIISAAGYVGSALIGALLIYTGSLPQIQRLALLLFGLGCSGMTFRYTPWGGLDFILGVVGGLILVGLALRSERAGVAGAVWMGVMLCLYSLYDFRTDLWYYPEHTDAGILAAYWGLPLTHVIAISWALFSVAVMYRAMRSLIRHQKG